MLPIHLLIVEDQADDVQILTHVLQKAGVNFEYVLVDNENDYLLELEKFPDLIISDFSLSSFDGLRALKLLKERNVDIPFIIVSEAMAEEIAVEAIKLGANDCIMKNKLNYLPMVLERELKEKENGQAVKEIEPHIVKNKKFKHSDFIKSTFIATMSHELRTPLNAIIGFSEVLKDELLGPLTQKQKEYCSGIYSSGQFLLDLINDILDLSRIESGKMELAIEPIDLKSLLEELLTMFKPKANLYDVNLTLEMTEHLGICNYDPKKLKQIICNLLSHAVKCSPTGSTVTLSSYLKNKYTLVIAVANMGVEISKKDLKKLFKPFEQIYSASKREEKETGLGLVIAKYLAELHGGAINATSTKGRGTTFRVELPYLSSESQEKIVSQKVYERNI